MDLVAIALFWVLLIRAYLKGGRHLLYLFFISMSFGAFAVIPTAMTGGLTFTPTPIVALAIAARYLGNRHSAAYVLVAATSPRRLGLLAAFFIFSAIATYFSPRLFAGEALIIPVRGLLNDPEPLRPTTQNLSQLIYLGISIISVFSFGKMLQDRNIHPYIYPALVYGAITVLITGFLDYFTQFVPVAFLLEPFRTATYALLTDVEVFGGKRVVGLTPEASSYGTLCISFLSALYFLRFYIRTDVPKRPVLSIVLLLLIIFTWLSKSSSAYVGLIFIALCAVGEWLWRASALENNPRRKKGLKLEFAVVVTAIVSLTVVLLVIPSLLDPITALFDRMVLQKTESQSFEQRSSWTAISWGALLQSYGLGVGVGSTRASNGVVAIFAGSGFLGAALYYGFMLQMMLRRAARFDFASQAALSGIRWTYLPPNLLIALIGTSADFGLFIAWLYGFAFALSSLRQPRSTVAQVSPVLTSPRRIRPQH